MDLSNKKYMWNNLQALKMKNILTMCTNFIRHSMDLSKLLQHGMNALVTFSLTMVLGLVKTNSTLFTRKVDKDLFVC
jgi:hypothetical protein